MYHFSLRRLMAFVLGSAIGLAALRNANDWWAGVTLTAVFGTIGAAVIAALILRDKERYIWAGFAIFGGGYFLVALGPALNDRFKPYVGTTALITYAQSRVAEASYRALDKVADPEEQRAIIRDKIKAYEAMPGNPHGRSIEALKRRLSTMGATNEEQHALEAAAERWRSSLPGALNENAFFCVGHCLFALAAGIVGVIVAKWFYERRERGEASSSVT